MRAVVQRVARARVVVDGAVTGSVERGFLVLLGVEDGDGEKHAEVMAGKIARLRVFVDAAGKMNLALGDVGGRVLAVSQFTLCADTSKGNRPSFANAAPPERAKALYDYFCDRLRDHGAEVEQGIFGAHMDVSLLNDGPVTICLDTKDWGLP